VRRYKFIMRKNNVAQSIIEYVIFFAVIITVILIMSKYLRGSFSGKLRSMGDKFGGSQVYEYKKSTVTEGTTIK